MAPHCLPVAILAPGRAVILACYNLDPRQVQPLLARSDAPYHRSQTTDAIRHRRRKHGGNGGFCPQTLKVMGPLPPIDLRPTGTTLFILRTITSAPKPGVAPIHVARDRTCTITDPPSRDENGIECITGMTDSRVI